MNPFVEFLSSKGDAYQRAAFSFFLDIRREDGVIRCLLQCRYLFFELKVVVWHKLTSNLKRKHDD